MIFLHINLVHQVLILIENINNTTISKKATHNDFYLSDSLLDEIRKEIPVLPNQRLIKYITEYNLAEGEAKTIVKDKNLSDYFDKTISLGVDAKTTFNYLSGQILGYLNKEYLSITDIYLTPERLKFIIGEVTKGTISSKQGKELIMKCLEEKEEPSVLMEKYGMKQMDNDSELENIIDNILSNTLNDKRQMTEKSFAFCYCCLL